MATRRSTRGRPPMPDLRTLTDGALIALRNDKAARAELRRRLAERSDHIDTLEATIARMTEIGHQAKEDANLRIDTLTRERDEWKRSYEIAGHASGNHEERALAAEAEVARLREALAEIAGHPFDGCRWFTDRARAALDGRLTDDGLADRESCGACGATTDVAYRGWADDGSPMPTCAACGAPDVTRLA